MRIAGISMIGPAIAYAQQESPMRTKRTAASSFGREHISLSRIAREFASLAQYGTEPHRIKRCSVLIRRLSTDKAKSITSGIDRLQCALEDRVNGLSFAECHLARIGLSLLQAEQCRS